MTDPQLQWNQPLRESPRILDRSLAPGETTPVSAADCPELLICVAGGLDEYAGSERAEVRAFGLSWAPARVSRCLRAGAQGARYLSIQVPEDGLGLDGPGADATLRFRGGAVGRAGMRLFWRHLALSGAVLPGLPNPGDRGLGEALAELLGALREAVSARPARPAPHWMERALTVLGESFVSPPTIRGLASQVHLDPSHLARSFRRFQLRTVGDHIRLLRLERALELLREGGSKLIYVASATGFADQAHFSRTFKRELGVPPGDYRRILCPGRGSRSG